jgi:hypothetical protein
LPLVASCRPRPRRLIRVHSLASHQLVPLLRCGIKPPFCGTLAGERSPSPRHMLSNTTVDQTNKPAAVGVCWDQRRTAERVGGGSGAIGGPPGPAVVANEQQGQTGGCQW